MDKRAITSFKGDITELDVKSDILINFVNPQYNEVYENNIGIVEKAPLLAEEVIKELAKNPDNKAVITSGGGLYTSHILHIIKESISSQLNNISMGYYICETTILTALYETLKIKDAKTVAIPLIGGLDNQDFIALATINACRRFYEEHPESSVNLIIIADNREIVDDKSAINIGIAAQTAEIGMEIIENLKEVVNHQDLTKKELGSLDNIKFIEFGSEQGNVDISSGDYIKDYNKSSSFLSSEEIDNMLFVEEDLEGYMESTSKGVDGINQILEEISTEMGNELNLDGISTILEILGVVFLGSKNNYNLTIHVSKTGKLNIKINIE